MSKGAPAAAEPKPEQRESRQRKPHAPRRSALHFSTDATPGPGATGAGRPLIAHVIYRLDVGGLENGLVNLINHLPQQRYRHAIVCLRSYSDFSRRIRVNDVALHALHKRPGKDFKTYARLYRLLRKLRPAACHTRNLGTLDCQIIAAMAGVPVRIHGEHGWDVTDLHGSNRKYNFLRRFCRPFVHRYVPMSKHLDRWLRATVHVSKQKIRQVYNGVDTRQFHPAPEGRDRMPREGFCPANGLVIGTVGRFEAVKSPVTLVLAFDQLRRLLPDKGSTLRLVLVGDGPMRSEVERAIARAGLVDSVWITGQRDDVAALLRAMDIFALPSLNEGISNTVLEAMASGLPVVATDVGGNPELIQNGTTGLLCPPDDPVALAQTLARYARDPDLRSRHGARARARVESCFSLEAMVAGYQALYDELLGLRQPEPQG